MIKVREATEDDNWALIELQRKCPMGTRLALRLNGSPDFFARSRAYEDWHVLVATEDEKIVGSAAYTRKEAVIDGELVETVYEYGFIVDPERRRRGIASMLQGQIEESVRTDVDLLHLNITADNLPSINLFTKLGFERVKECRACMLMAYRRHRPVDDLHIRNMTQADVSDVVNMLNDFYRDHVFYRTLTAEAFLRRYRGLPHFDLQNIWVYDDGGVKACLGYWDYNKVMRFAVERYMWRWRILRPILEVVGIFAEVPRIPKQGEQISNWYLTPIACRDPKGLTALLKHLLNKALEENVDFVSVPLDLGSPLTAILSIFRRYEGEFGWYMKSLGQRPIPDLLDKRLYIDVADI
jgi:GNAT superfamily N-acetyltransferase